MELEARSGNWSVLLEVLLVHAAMGFARCPKMVGLSRVWNYYFGRCV